MKNRINILDGFRAVAIISVLLFHFYSTFGKGGGGLQNPFSYGYLGVQFFFMISGFVIFFTLENTDDFIIFWKKRFIRLFPAMLIASSITLWFFIIFDTNSLYPNGHSFKNFILSLTFVTPEIFRVIFSNPKLSYLNGSYWSLWPEIQFYALASVLYFCSRKKFVVNFVICCFCLISLKIVSSQMLEPIMRLPEKYYIIYRYWFIEVFNLSNYIVYFASGCMFYLLFKNNRHKLRTSYFVKASSILFIILQILLGTTIEERIISLAMIILFWSFVYYSDE
nr:acyltransferase [uncultured Pedobacter sp.]